VTRGTTAAEIKILRRIVIGTITIVEKKSVTGGVATEVIVKNIASKTGDTTIHNRDTRVVGKPEQR
jgi:hypothetical protein